MTQIITDPDNYPTGINISGIVVPGGAVVPVATGMIPGPPGPPGVGLQGPPGPAGPSLNDTDPGDLVAILNAAMI